MEYRIIQRNGHFGLYEVTNINGKVVFRKEPIVKADSLKELQQAITLMNKAFWKDAFVQS